MNEKSIIYHEIVCLLIYLLKFCFDEQLLKSVKNNKTLTLKEEPASVQAWFRVAGHVLRHSDRDHYTENSSPASAESQPQIR